MILISSALALVVLISAGAFIWRTELQTLSTLENLDGNGKLYQMRYYTPYDLDEMLFSNLDTPEKLYHYILRKSAKFLYPLMADSLTSELASKGFGCSSFTASTPAGDVLLARNYDYAQTPILLTHSKPERGYESIALTDLSFLGYGQANLPDAWFNRMETLGALYSPMDGMNEKGLAISILELTRHPTQQDTGKPRVLTTPILRLVLDRCATVEEAITLFKSVDLRDPLVFGHCYHYHIADASGNSAVIEYDYQNDFSIMVFPMSKNEKFQIVNNHYLSQPYAGDGTAQSGEGSATGKSWERRDIIRNGLAPTQGVVSEQAAMSLLAQAKMKDLYFVDENFMVTTQWSAVYNLTDLTLKLCVGQDYGRVYEFTFLGE